MKKVSVIFLAFFSITFFAKAQDKNENLYQAIIQQDTVKMLSLMIEGADVNYIKQSGPWMKVSMLITAVNTNNIELVKLLLKNKADVNWKDGFKTSALMYAAAKGNKELVVYLLDNGADINAKDDQGNTVISAAKESKNKELVEFIQERAKGKKQ